MDTDKLIELALACQLEINGISVTLKQRASDNPVTYNGAGNIKQDLEGDLSLHMIQVSTNDEFTSQLKGSVLDSNLRSGTIIPDSHYYDLALRDTYGYEWTAEKIKSPGTDFFCPTKSVVVRPKIERLVRRFNYSEKQKIRFVKMVVPYSVELPCNEYESYGNGGKRLTILKLNMNDFEIIINNANDRLIIIASAKKTDLDLEVLAIALLHGLSIITGREIVPTFKEVNDGIIQLIEVRKSFKTRSKPSLPRPFESKDPSEVANTQLFLDKYITAYLQKTSDIADLHGYWHKVLMGYRTTTELWALALTTSIEGVFKNHFSNLLLHEKDYVLKIDDSLSKIATANVNPEIFQKLQSTLNGFKQRNITAGLKQYIADKPQFNNWPKNWTTLRNKSAHPDALDESQVDFQIYLNQAFTCLAIFYHLLGRTIKFEGKLIAYGIPNWPSLSAKEELLTAAEHEILGIPE